MIGSTKNNRENYPRKCFWKQEKETWVNFNPGLSANRLSNNWAQAGLRRRRNQTSKFHRKSQEPEKSSQGERWLWLRSDLVPGHGARVSYSLGTVWTHPGASAFTFFGLVPRQSIALLTQNSLFRSCFKMASDEAIWSKYVQMWVTKVWTQHHFVPFYQALVLRHLVWTYC